MTRERLTLLIALATGAVVIVMLGLAYYSPKASVGVVSMAAEFPGPAVTSFCFESKQAGSLKANIEGQIREQLTSRGMFEAADRERASGESRSGAGRAAR